MAKVVAEDQSAVLRVSAVAAADVDAPHVECALNSEVSISARDIISLSHLEMIEETTG